MTRAGRLFWLCFAFAWVAACTEVVEAIEAAQATHARAAWKSPTALCSTDSDCASNPPGFERCAACGASSTIEG